MDAFEPVIRNSSRWVVPSRWQRLRYFVLRSFAARETDESSPLAVTSSQERPAAEEYSKVHQCFSEFGNLDLGGTNSLFGPPS